MTKYAEAWRLVMDRISALEAQPIKLLEALGYVLAEDIYADIDLPNFNNSVMDGYALQSADTVGASLSNPVVLGVIEDLPAGYVAKKAVTAGTAIRIMTGAAIPVGADAVIRVEDTQKAVDKVKVFKQVKAGEFIREVGEDVKAGELVLKKGLVINAAALGMLAAVGKAEVNCIRRPEVAVITTGDELVDIWEVPGLGKLRDTNRYSIVAQVLDNGGIVISTQRVEDDHRLIEEAILAGLAADMVLVSGGVSVGEYDVVKGVMRKLGELLFERVAMSPGGPTVFTIINGKPVFGLPGNVASSMISFEQFVRPALWKLAGKTELERPEVIAKITGDYKSKLGIRKFLRAKTYEKAGEYVAELTGSQKPGVLSSMVPANSLVVIPEDMEMVRAGDRVMVQLIE